MAPSGLLDRGGRRAHAGRRGRQLSVQWRGLSRAATAVALLADPRPFPGRLLRGLEFSIFGVAAAYLALRQYETMLHLARQGDSTSQLATAKNTLLGSIPLQFTYALLVPNH